MQQTQEENYSVMLTPVKGTPASRRLELEDSIQHEIRGIAKSKSVIKIVTEEIKMKLLSHLEYRAADDEVKEAQKRRVAMKAQVMKTDPALSELELKLMTERNERKMAQLTLSDYLVEFQELTGLKTVPDEQGMLFEFEMFARLKKPL